MTCTRRHNPSTVHGAGKVRCACGPHAAGTVRDGVCRPCTMPVRFVFVWRGARETTPTTGEHDQTHHRAAGIGSPFRRRAPLIGSTVPLRQEHGRSRNPESSGHSSRLCMQICTDMLRIIKPVNAVAPDHLSTIPAWPGGPGTTHKRKSSVQSKSTEP